MPCTSLTMRSMYAVTAFPTSIASWRCGGERGEHEKE